MLQLFPIYKGKRSGDEAIDKENITGYFKGALKIYKFNDVDSSRVLTPSGYDVKSGAFQEWPSNEREPFVVRVYCVRGLRLISKDTFGKSDAYISVKMGRQIKKFRDEYIPNQFNPVFGKYAGSYTFPRSKKGYLHINRKLNPSCSRFLFVLRIM